MQTITLNIADHAVDKVKAFLKELPKHDVQVVEEKSISQVKSGYRLGALPDLVVPDNFDDIEVTEFDV